VLRIGLTGGIGSGKSAASGYFEELGILVVDADIVAREVVEPGTVALSEIAKAFGDAIINADQTLNRGKLRDIIFSDATKKAWLETLLHPIIREEIIKQLDASSTPYSLLVSPLLFETDQHHLVDRILLIDLPEALQIQRAAKRDENTEQQIKKIIASQLPRDYKLKHANDVISNHLGTDELKQAIQRQHKIYKALAHEQKH
jgi:dephospho-CoA kinase